MRILSFLLLLMISTLFIACGGEVSSNSGSTTTEESDTTAMTDNSEGDIIEAPTSHDCEVEGEILEGNEFWIRDSETLVVIKADSTTYDADFGPSHRILEVYNTQSCNQVFRQVLPVNVSPDFAYFLAQILYNNSSKLVGIRAFGKIYCYDVENQQLLEPLTPKFQAERFAEDAQSGMIQRLEVWEDFLVGYSQDKGAFVLNFKDKANPEAVMPFSEVSLTETDFASLFLLPSSGGGMQAILPKYDPNTGEFAINPLLETPTELETNIPKSARNNRFLVIKTKGDAATSLAVDLQNFTRVDLPADQQNKKTQEILSWMRANVK